MIDGPSLWRAVLNGAKTSKVRKIPSGWLRTGFPMQLRWAISTHWPYPGGNATDPGGGALCWRTQGLSGPLRI